MTAEVVLQYFKNEADKEVVRKAKEKERNILEYKSISNYRGCKKRRSYMGGRRG